MTDPTHDQLEQAFRLIKNDELDKALAILKPIVAAHPDNADAWWLLANAVSDAHEAQNALDNVLRLNPGHTQAREQRAALASEFPELAATPASSVPDTSFDNLDDLFGSTPEPAGSPAVSSDFGSFDNLYSSTPESADSTVSSPDFGSFGDEPVVAGTSSTDLDDLFSTGSTFQPDADLDSMFGDANRKMDVLDDDPFASTSGEPGFLQEAIEPAPAAKPARPEKKPKAAKVKEPPPPLDPLEIERRANSRTSPFVRILLVLLLVLIIGGGIGAAYLSGLFGNRGGPEQTPVPVTGVAVVVTAPATESATGGSFQSIIEAFTASQYTDVQAAVVQSSLGDTLQIQVCGAPGPSLQTKVNEAMDMVATEAAKMRDTIKAAGIQFVSCAKPDVTLYRAVAPISAVTAYIDGAKKDHRTFRAAWKTT